MPLPLHWEVDLGNLPEPAEPDFVQHPEADDGGPPTPPPVLVRGVVLDFPYRFRGTGSLADAVDMDAIRVGVRQILGTEAATPGSRGELAWDHDQGSVIHRLRHMMGTPATEELARQYVVDALRRYIPAIRVVSATIEAVDDKDSGGVVLRIALTYDVPALGLTGEHQRVEV